jgi:hypothetical protein
MANRRRPSKRIFAMASLVAAAGFAGLTWGGCRYDPVPQQAIDKLPPEDPDGPSEFHRAGQPCVLCHSEYEGADPELAFGGTVYEQNPATFQLIPIEGVFVTIYDAEGASAKACTNAAGNFHIELTDYPDAKFPLTVQVGNRFMRSLIGRERSCAHCHELATPSRVENDPTVDSTTGAGRTSAGAILVDRAAIPPEEQCGQNPASAASSGAGGGNVGGAGGAMGAGGGGGGS